MRAAGTVAAAALLTEADLTFGNSEANNREIGSARCASTRVCGWSVNHKGRGALTRRAPPFPLRETSIST